MSQFAFLDHEWAAVFDAAARTETAVHADPNNWEQLGTDRDGNN